MEENKNIEAQNEEEITNQNEVSEDTSQASENVEQEQSTEPVSEEQKSEPKKSKKQIKEEREEARRQELASLSDDELYARLQTEKLLKSRKTKRVATTATLCVAFVLALLVIISAIVPISYVPVCLKGDVESVKLYKSGSTSAVATITMDDSRYSTFKSLLNSSFSQSYLTALFSGSLSSYDIDETGSSLEEYKGNTTTSELQSVLDLAGDNYLIQFNFAEAQTFTYQNGKAYTSVYTSINTEYTFNTAYLSVSTDEDSGLTTTEVYVIAVYPTTAYTSGYSSKIITVSVKADTSVIYSNWSSLLS